MVKIIVIALICAILILYLKHLNSELVLPATVCSGLLILSLGLTYLSDIFEFFNNLLKITGLNSEVYKIIFKITAIGYLVDFGAGTLSDFGLTSLSNKVVFVGKIIIFSISIPIIYAVINLLTGIL